MLRLTNLSNQFNHGIRLYIRSMGSSSDPIKTPLYDLHLKKGGKIVDFAGYALPVTYDGLGVMKEHNLVREHAAIFDVSHMGQIIWTGADRVKFLERVVCGDIDALDEKQSCLSLVTTETGGVMDDTVITNAGDHIYQVVNGAAKHGDMKHFENEMKKFGGDVQMKYLDDQALIAIQGPNAASHLVKKGLLDEALAKTMPFMSGIQTKMMGYDCRITRCGYTGEDGFEIGMDASAATEIVSAMIDDVPASEIKNNNVVTFAGLGARDSLRLEAGLCLYGHDLNTKTTPAEAALLWTVPKSRRNDVNGFIGAEKILEQIKTKKLVTKKRVGLTVTGPPAREGAKIFKDGEEVGVMTSGSYSPTLKRGIGMGYVKKSLMKVGTEVEVEVRGKKRPATVTKMPFVPQRYFRLEVEEEAKVV